MNKYITTESHDVIKTSGNVWGVVDGKVLKIIKTSQSHFVKKYQGYGVSEITLDRAEKSGATDLFLQGYNGEVFRLTIRQFRAAAIPDDLGTGQQLFLSIRWLKYYTQQNELEKLPKQMSLFG